MYSYYFHILYEESEVAMLNEGMCSVVSTLCKPNWCGYEGPLHSVDKYWLIDGSRFSAKYLILP